MFGINLGSIPGLDDVVGGLGLDKLIDSPLASLAASAFLGPVAGPIAAQFAAPLVKEILGSSDAVVRDHRSPRPPFQVPTTLGTSSDDLVQAFAGLEKQKEALIKDLSSDDPAKAFAAKLKLEALDKAQNFLISFDEQKQKTLQRCTQLT